MAVVAISLIKTGAMNTAVFAAFTAISVDGCTVPIGKDERLAFVATNANIVDKNVIVAKGDGINAAAAALTITVPAGGFVAFELDSSRYGKMTGTNKGKFSITSDAGADVKLAPIQLV